MSTKGSVSVRRKVAYGFGSVAFGVKSNGFDYFFLIFYSQVMGVSACADDCTDGGCLERPAHWVSLR